MQDNIVTVGVIGHNNENVDHLNIKKQETNFSEDIGQNVLRSSIVSEEMKVGGVLDNHEDNASRFSMSSSLGVAKQGTVLTGFSSSQIRLPSEQSTQPNEPMGFRSRSKLGKAKLPKKEDDAEQSKVRKYMRTCLGICCLRPTGRPKQDVMAAIEEEVDEESVDEVFSDDRGPHDIGSPGRSGEFSMSFQENLELSSEPSKIMAPPATKTPDMRKENYDVENPSSYQSDS